MNISSYSPIHFQASDITGIFAALLIIIIVFLLCRKFLTWYWKINESLKSLKNIESKLDLLNENIARYLVKMDNYK